VLTLSPGSHNTASSGSSSPGTTPSRSHSASPSASPTPTVGELQLKQFRVGDCLTGANLQLNQNTPWPKLSQAVPCGQGHTAEVFYANNYYWAKNAPFPGANAITQTATAECNNAFQSYVGIASSKSIYTWTVTVPNQSTWPTGDRELHCMAYYKTNAVPSGETLHGSIRGTAK